MKLKVATLNVWSGIDYHGILKMGEVEPKDRLRMRTESLISSLKEINPDVFVLNEANPAPTYGSQLAEILDMDFCWHYGVSGLRVGKFGLPINLREADMIFARKGLNLKYIGQKHLMGKGFVKQSLSVHFDNLTQAVLASIEVDGKQINICATHWYAHPATGEVSLLRIGELARKWHFSSSQIKRAKKRLLKDQQWKNREARTLLKFIKRKSLPDTPLICLGDFNASPSWEEIQILEDAGWVDTFDIAGEGDCLTWNAEKNPNLKKYYIPETEKRQKSLYHQLHAEDEKDARRIDYIFVAGGIKSDQVKSCKLSFDQADEHQGISDHYGVVSEIEIY